MKQKKSRDWQVPLLLVGAIAPFVIMLGLIALYKLVGQPSSWSMPLGTFVWSLIAATAITCSLLSFLAIRKKEEGGARGAIFPAAMQFLAIFFFLGAILMSEDLFEMFSGSYLALGLVGLTPGLIVFNCWMYRRARQIGRPSTARAFLMATEYMSLGVLVVAWSYLSQAVSWSIAVDILLVIGMAAVFFGDIWRAEEDASGLGRFLRKFIKSPQRG